MAYYKKNGQVPFAKSIKRMSQPVTAAQSKFGNSLGRVVKTFVKTKK